MSEITEGVREKVWQILHDHKREDEWATVVSKILSIPEIAKALKDEEKLRRLEDIILSLRKETGHLYDIAIVDREVELPRWLCDPALTIADNIRGYKELLRKEGWGKGIKA